MSDGMDGALAPRGPSVADLTRYFLRLGAMGFGGPIALVGYMQRDLVEERRWFSKRDYLEGLALAQLAPGPLAAQLAIYLGWLRGGVLGATVVAVAFVVPSFVMVLGLAAAYLRYEGIGWMQGAFYGVGAAVIAIIARSVWKLVGTSLGGDRLLWAICAVVIPAAYFRRAVGYPRVRAFVTGVTAAATGAIAGAAFVLGRRAIVDVPTAAVAVGTLIALASRRRIPEPAIIVAAGLVGVLLRG